ncbi:MAG: NosD domain-containing protein, partial [Candidatus Hydrothermarchaeales archaeon]
MGGRPFLIRGGIVIVVLIGILVLAGSVSAATIYVNGTNTGPWDGLSEATGWANITAGINNATDGDNVTVVAGFYTENVDVNVSVNLVGAGVSVTVVNASNSSDHVFEVTANSVNISGFTLTGATGSDGVYLFNSNYSKIENVDASNNSIGIVLLGSYTTISNNTANNNTGMTGEEGPPSSGILVLGSHNTIRNNSLQNNIVGILITPGDPTNPVESTNNTLTGNNISANTYNFWVDGNSISDFVHTIDTSNTVDGKPIYYLVEVSNQVINSSTDAGYVGIVNSVNVTVKDLTFKKNGQGVLFANTTNSSISNVTASNNDVG